MRLTGSVPRGNQHAASFFVQQSKNAASGASVEGHFLPLGFS